MDWNNDKTIEFIDSYRNFTCLWRYEDRSYKNRIIRNNAVQELGTKYSITPKQVLNKIKSLRSYFHKEHAKRNLRHIQKQLVRIYFHVIRSLRSGIETEVSDYGIQENNSDTEKNSEIGLLGVETTTASTNQQIIDVAAASSKSKRNKNSSQVDEDYNFLSEAKKKLRTQDRFSYFGEVVACKLRSLNDPRLQAVAEFEINKILFEVEMQSLNKQFSCPNMVLKPDNRRPGSSTTNN
nr:unnamed protein product [Callosobruchus chinensis]